MKKHTRNLLTVLAIGFTWISAAIAGNGTSNGNGTSYDLDSEITVTAVYLGINPDTPGLMDIELEDGTLMQLVTAPAWYLEQQEITIETGTTVTVTGMPATLQTGTDGLIVRQLITADTLYVFRDEFGVPLWISRRGAGESHMNVNAGGGLFSLLETTPAGELEISDEDALLHMREEEKLARDVYTTLFTVWNQVVFSRIAESEQSHMDAVLYLINRYELDDPADGNGVGEFTNSLFTDLFTQLVEAGSLSLTDGLLVGATIEDLDIQDLVEILEVTEQEDLRIVYQNLLKGSRNHLRSFVGMLEDYGISYTPVYISEELFRDVNRGVGNAIVLQHSHKGPEVIP